MAGKRKQKHARYQRRTPPPSPPPSPVLEMDKEWGPSKTTIDRLNQLVVAGVLPDQEAVGW